MPSHDYPADHPQPPALSPADRRPAYAPRPHGAGATAGRLFIVLLVLGLIVAGLGAKFVMGVMKMKALADSGAFMPPAVTVTTTTIQPAKWQPTLSAIGSLEAVQGTTVSADLAGMVKEILFESGKTVRQGDILVRLVTDQEQAMLESSAAQRDLMTYSLRRAQELRGKNANSQSDLDTAQANERQAEANVSNAKAAISRKTIRAPFDGQLGIRKVSLGQYLHEGDAVVPLQSLDPIYVNFTLPQQNMRDFAVGSDVRVRTDATGAEEFSGKITAVNPLVDASTRNFQVQATLSNKNLKLRPGMFANVDVLLAGEGNVLPVPSSAIHYAPYGNSVFIFTKNMDVPPGVKVPNAPKDKKYDGVREQFVRTGQTKGDLVAILSGLKEGEQIVTSGVFKLQNGSAVKIDNAVQPEAKEDPKPEES